MPVLARLDGKRIIAKASFNNVTAGAGSSGGAARVTVTLSDLKNVEQILDVVFTRTSANLNATAQSFATTGNVIGFSVYLSAGGTVSGDVIVLGF